MKSQRKLKKTKYRLNVWICVPDNYSSYKAPDIIRNCKFISVMYRSGYIAYGQPSSWISEWTQQDTGLDIVKFRKIR